MGKPLETLNRKELIATLSPKARRHLRADNGDLPEEDIAAVAAAA
jgi:hypothetical protein